MFGGGGGMNPRKMRQMMDQMGIDVTEIDAEEVIIRTDDTEYVFHDADVQRMDAQGQQTYQVVGDDSEPFVREERNVFAKFVREVDPAVRPRDEVLVEHHDGSLLAVGRAELSAAAMHDFDTGMAVSVREGVAGK